MAAGFVAAAVTAKSSAFRSFFGKRSVQDVFFAFLQKRGGVPLGAPFSIVEDCFCAEVFCFFECVDFALAIDNESESNTLDAPGTEPGNARLLR